VIHDVDETLKALLVQKMPIDPDTVEIRFDTPNREWSAAVVAPTLNLFLYDIRENLELRSHERVRSGRAGAVTQSPAPVRIDLSYMITAWTTDVSDEHQLLGRVLTTLLRFPQLPADILRGSLVNQPFALRAWIAQSERTPNPWDFWGNVEHRMKAGLNFVLTAALQPLPDEELQLARETVFNISEIN
jgi:hypothetical protein